MQRIRIEVYAHSTDVLKDYIAQIARETGFVPEPNAIEPIMESNWWVYGTGPANLQHELVGQVEVVGRPAPLIAQSPAKRIRIKVYAHSLEALAENILEIARDTGFVPEANTRVPINESTWWIYGAGRVNLAHELVRAVEVVKDAPAPAPVPPPARPQVKLRISVYGWGQQALDTAQEVARETPFVLDDPLRCEPHLGSTMWYYGTGPANLKHDAIHLVEVVNEPAPQPAPVPKPASQRRLKLTIQAASVRQAKLTAAAIAADTSFVWDQTTEPQAQTHGVWIIFGTGPANLKNELIEKVEILEGRLKVHIRAASPKQALLTARAIASETKFVLDETSAPTVEVAGASPIYAVYGTGPGAFSHELVESVTVIG